MNKKILKELNLNNPANYGVYEYVIRIEPQRGSTNPTIILNLRLHRRLIILKPFGLVRILLTIIIHKI